MPTNVDADINLAIQVTLDSWRNPDGSFLNATQRTSLDSYLHRVGSGPNGDGSYADWLKIKLLENPQFIEELPGQPRIGATYGFYSTEQGKFFADAHLAYLRSIGQSGGLIGETSWARFANTPSAQSSFSDMGARLRNFAIGNGWTFTIYDPLNGSAQFEFKAALSDVAWGSASGGYARAAVTFGSGKPFYYGPESSIFRIASQIEFPILKDGGQILNSTILTPEVTFNDIKDINAISIAKAIRLAGGSVTSPVPKSEIIRIINEQNIFAQVSAQVLRPPQGVEIYARANPNGGFDFKTAPTSSPPSGEGWVSQTDARAGNPSIYDKGVSVKASAEQQISAIRADPSSRLPNGELTPGAISAVGVIDVAANAAFVGLLYYDAVETGQKAAAKCRAGDQVGCIREIVGAEGRWLGMTWGAELGLTVGGSIGGPFFPFVAVMGLLIGGLAGAIIGEAGFHNISLWLTNLFGGRVTQRDPLIVDLSTVGKGVSFTQFSASNVHFDLNSDGYAERTGWINPSSGFVVMDRNGNGVIDNGSELFGDNAQNGFMAIGALDSNNDGTVSSLDTAFASLRIWQDLNLDGISQANELRTLADTGVVSIDLSSTTYVHDFRNNVQILAHGSFTNAYGESREALAVSFWIDQINSEYILPQGFQYDPEVFTLPNLRGYGTVPDLWIAMSLDPTLKQMVKDFLANPPSSEAALIGKQVAAVYVEGTDPNYIYHAYSSYGMSPFEEIIARWSGETIVDHGAFEMQATLEKFLGQSFRSGVQLTLENYWLAQAGYFEPYRQFTTELATRFLTQAAGIAQNKAGLDLYLALNAGGANGSVLTQSQIDALVSQAMTAAGSQPPLSALLQHYSHLLYDFSSDALGGDVATFIDEEMSGLTISSTDPWGGPTSQASGSLTAGTTNSWGVISFLVGFSEYDDWFASHNHFLAAVDPDGWITDERHRAATNNHSLPILRDYYHAEQIGTSGSDTQTVTPVSGNTNPRTVFIGDAGNDTMTGGTGSDAYVFGDGFGNDTISDPGGTEDEIAFQGGLTASLAHLQFSPGSRTDLLISFTGRTDTVTVRNFFGADGTTNFETLSFADGSKLTPTEIRHDALLGLATSGADSITGFDVGGEIDGLAGDDQLTGGYGDDLFIGASGNDLLIGRDGNDTYQFDLGDGQDIIRETNTHTESTADTIKFGIGIKPSDITVTQTDNGNDIVLQINGTTDQITLDQTINDWSYRIEFVTFVDGTVWNAADLLAKSLVPTAGNDTFYGGYNDDSLSGGAGNDTLYGRFGNDTLIGGTGNDLLIGGDGNDTYHFDLGDGQDIVRDSVNQSSSIVDTIEFGIGIAPNDVTVLVADGGNDLILKINGTADQITLDQTVNDWTNRIDFVKFADGTVWSAADLLTKALAPTSGDDTFYGSYDGDILQGGAGNDTLYGRGGSDTLIGGTGNDLLIGGNGNDTYHFDRGDGQDIVRDSVSQGSSVDTIEFGLGIASSDITAVQSDNGNDIVLKINGTADQITLDQTVNDWTNQIEFVRFADGTIWTASDLIAKVTGATLGDDVINGSSASELLAGLSGNDTIYGKAGDDILIGGTGNDLLIGGEGNDTYRFELGDGQDIVRDSVNQTSSTDTIEFGLGIAPSDVTVVVADGGNDLILKINGTADEITLDQTVNDWQNRIEFVRFADGTVWSAADLLTKALVPTPGDDTFYGSYDGDVLQGGAGNDTLYGRDGNDTLIGGTGNDLLIGGNGSDTYRFDRGDGQDIVRDILTQGNSTDTIEFGLGIAPSDVTVVVADGGNDLILKINGTADQITLDQTVNDWQNRIEFVRFADGTVWSAADLLTKALVPTSGDDTFYGSYDGDVLQGGAGNDTLYGRDGNDTLIGGTGNDLLIGGNGNDTYRFDRGDGQDIVRDSVSQTSSTDTIEFGIGIAPIDVSVFFADGGNDLILKINGTTDQITLDQTVNDWTNQIDFVRFADGTVWSAADLLARAIPENRAPIIGSVSSVSGSITELAATTGSGLMATSAGTIVFTDADLSDLHTATIVSVTANGISGGLPVNATLLSWLTKGALTEQSGATSGTLPWNFTAPDSSFDYLRAGQTATLTYVVQLSDGRGGTVSQNVAVTITGSNDAPAIVTGTASTFALVELASVTGSITSDAASGIIRFNDADLGDLHSATVGAVTTSGAIGGLPTNAMLLSFISLGGLTEQSGATPGSFAWNFAAQDKTFDYLAAGESVTLTYNVQLSDGQGGVVAQPVTVTVTGTNDVPVVAAGGTLSGAITELAAVTGSAANDTVSGALKFSDADLSDLHSATIASVTASGITSGLPANAALLGWLSKGALSEQAGATAGSLPWTFSAADSSFDYLRAGQTATLTYVVQIADGTGGTLAQNIVVTVTGSNDAPVITTGTNAILALTELAAILGSTTNDSGSGLIKFSDAESGDTHTASLVSVAASGVTSGLPANATLLSFVSLGALTEQAGATPGSFAWNFAAQDKTFDYLAAGESVTLTYNVQLSEGQGGVVAQPVTVTVTGTNDVPVVAAGGTLSGAITELAAVTGSAANDTVSGALKFSDADLSDLHSATIASVTASGITSGLPANAALLGWLSKGALSEQAGATAGSLPWTFSAADSSFDYLGAGQIATLTYVVQIADGKGGTLGQNVVITITGSNDAPVVTVPGAQNARLSIATRMAGITIADADANAASETVTLTTAVGTVAATATGGATLTGSASKLLTISGTITQINATLATLTYTATATAGSDTITVAGKDGTATTTKTIAVTTSSTANHGPVINAGSTAAGAVTELTGAFNSATADTATGSIKFDDADVPDTHTVTISSVTATGITSGLPANATLLTMLTKGTVTESTGTTPGAVTWTFSATDKTFDYLGAGQIATLSYVVTVTDSKSAATTQTVTITVTGTNDAAVLATGSTSTGAITELASVTGSTANDTVSGAIKFTDESGDTHSALITGVAASGTIAGLPASAAMLAWLSKGTLTEMAGTTPGSLAWTFTAPDSAFDYLSAAQTATLTYTVTITDNSGAVRSQNVVVTVTGSNDTPTATAKSGFTTDNWTALTITGATLLAGATDPDKGDTLTLSSVQGAIGGTVALTSGNAVFTPTGSAIGAASFTYTISDGKGGTSTATASLTTTLHQTNGTTANDTISGNATKKAQIDGLAGNDTISAGGAGDIIIGGAGTDALTGGAGIDTFVYHAGFGLDTITSFTATGTSHDYLQFDKSLFADWAHLLGATAQVGSDLVITLDATDKITLKGIALANFTSADAVFV